MLSAELCRVCGSDAVSSDLTSIFIKRENVDCIADMILELSGLLVTANDRLPQNCCTVCQADLMTAITVRRRCLEMDKKFRISLPSIPSSDTSEAPDASLCLENNLDKAAVALQDDLDTAQESCRVAKGARNKVPLETDKQTNRSLDGDRIEAVKREDCSLDKQCCGCSESFSSEEELRAHSEKTHALEAPPSTEGRPFQCGICYRWFKSARGVIEHRSDRRNRRYQCATCGQRFSRPSRLVVHENLHSKAKAFPCDLCGEKFHNLYARRVHIRKSHGTVKGGPVTTGNECQQCGKSFRSASYLKSHQKLHANEAPHKCTVCGAQFKLPVYLKWHMKIHSGTYSCNHCNLSFKGPFDLREHQSRHIGYKDFVCTSCDKNFYTKKELNKHERRTHERKLRAAKN